MKLRLTANIEEMFTDESFQRLVERCVQDEICGKLWLSPEFNTCIDEVVADIRSRLRASSKTPEIRERDFDDGTMSYRTLNVLEKNNLRSAQDLLAFLDSTKSSFQVFRGIGRKSNIEIFEWLGLPHRR